MNNFEKKIISVVLLLIAMFSLVSCKADYRENNGDIAVTVGEFEVSYDFYSYFYLMYQKQGIEEQNREYTHEELTVMVENSLREIAAAMSIADEYGIKVSDEQDDEIREGIASIKEGYGDDEAFYAELAKNFMSEQVMYDIQYLTSLETNLREHLMSEEAAIIDFSDKEFEKALKNDFMAAVNILIFHDSQKDGLKGKELADSIYQKILAGEDIYSLAEEYSDDSYYKDRYFCPGTVHEYFEKKVASLEIGEISEVYDSEIGYNITKRVALDRDYIEEYYEELRSEFAYSKYLEMMDAKAGSMAISYSESFDISLIK